MNNFMEILKIDNWKDEVLWIAVYVGVGFSAMYFIPRREYIKDYEWGYLTSVAIIIFFILSSVTYVLGKLNNKKIDCKEGVKEILPPNIYSMLISFTLIIAGLCEFFLHPKMPAENIPHNPLAYFFPRIILSVVIGLNFYFSRFWRQKLIPVSIPTPINMEILKTRHSEWSYIVNALILIFFGAFAVVMYTYYLNTNADTVHIYINTKCIEETKYIVKANNSSSTINFVTFFDILIVSYNTIFAPILWLLRPVHLDMARIRNLMKGDYPELW